MTEQQTEPVIVGRRADPTRTTVVPLGPCRCPGSPHDQDSAVVRAELGEGEMRSASTRGGYSAGPMFDGARSDAEWIATFTLSWTLLDNAGEPIPITAAEAMLLDEEVYVGIMDELSQKSASATRRPLPNASGAPSRDSSRGSASRHRAAPRR